MDLLLISIWFLIALGVLISLFASSYFVYVRGARPIDVLAKFIFGLIVYGLLTSLLGFLAGMTVFVGTHSNPPGSVLSTGQLLIGGALILVYAVSGWLISSFIVGHLILRDRK